MDLLPGEPRAVVPEGQSGPGVQADGDASVLPGGLAFFPQGDGVHPVLQQFPEEDIGAFVQVVGEDVQHPAQVDLEAEGFGGG